MKRWVAWLVCLCLILAASLAYGAEDAPVLRLTELPALDEYGLYLPAGYADAGEKTADGLRVRLCAFGEAGTKEAPKLADCSPDGSCLVLTVEDQLLLLRGEELTAVMPEINFWDVMDAQPLVWSPDGRYAALLNGTKVFAKKGLQLGVVDTWSGVLTVVVPLEGDKVTQACFSGDSGALYYLAVETPQVSALMSYDLATGRGRRLGETSADSYYPGMYLDGAGRLVCSLASGLEMEYFGLCLWSPGAEGWQAEKITTSIPTNRVNASVMRYAPQSGLGLMEVDCYPKEVWGVRGLVLVDSARDYAGLDQLIYLTADDDTAAHTMALSDFGAADTVYRHMMEALLSPQGDRALIHTQAGKTQAYWLMDLSTLALTPMAQPQGLDTLKRWAAEDALLLSGYRMGKLFTLE